MDNPEDQARLQAAFELKSAGIDLVAESVELTTSLDLDTAAVFHEIEPLINPASPLKVKVEPLPRKPRCRKFELKPRKPRINNGIELVLDQQIRRFRRRLPDLSAAQQLNLEKELNRRFGDQAAELVVTAIYSDIPPETVKSIAISDDLRYASFIPSSGGKPAKFRMGFHLVVAHRGRNETERLLLRLD